jgi:glycosyltransferase involved in cell wall biosynthesis
LKYPNWEIRIVYWPINDQAPFEFDLFSDRLELWPVENVDDHEMDRMQSQWSPNLWVVSGWADKKYMRWSKKYADVYKVITFDTQWEVSLKFKLGVLYLYFKSIRNFQGVWVPGGRQRKLAEKLFFNADQIQEGFYVADTSLMEGLNTNREENERFEIIFVNRLVSQKGFPSALEYLERYIKKSEVNWHVTVVGTGPLQDSLPKGDWVDYLGFVQPKNLGDILRAKDVYVLSSEYEPWGVSVHEATACGLPLLLSSAVGAADSFLAIGRNGFEFKKGDYKEMIRLLKRISRMSFSERKNWGLVSLELSRGIDQDQWCGSLEYWIKLAKQCVE